MEKQTCRACGHELQGCPACKAKTEKRKPTLYTPDGHIMAQVTKPATRGKVNPMPKR